VIAKSPNKTPIESQDKLRDRRGARGRAEEPEQSIVDTSKMNKGQAAALEVAEAARDTEASASFGGELFLGRFRPKMLSPFPGQSEDEKAIGDEMVAKVSAFLSENLDPDRVDETREIPADVIQGLKDLGVFRMKIPAQYGGLGFSQVNYNRVMMAISSYCGSTAVLVSAHQSIGLPRPLTMCGNEAQKAEFLPRLASGEISAFALTEPDVGSDPARMTTSAALSEDGTHYVLNGVKQWCTNGPIADLLVVMARSGEKGTNGRARPSITAFIVEADQPGIETLHRCDFMGLRGIQNGLLRFTDVKVPVENVIWGEGLGLKMALKTLNTGRLTLPAACTGMAKRCLTIARTWGAEREQWGYPIGKHEAGADKIAMIASKTLAMEALTWLTSHWADEERDIRIEAAMAKLFCSEAAWEIVDTTLQLRGGRGYERAESLRARGEEPWPVERMLRDCRINTIIEGTSDIMKLFLAREALDPHLRRAGRLIHPRTPLMEKATSGVGVMAHYAGWTPMRLLGSYAGGMHGGIGALAGHYRYVDRTSSKLALTLFAAMAKNGPKLERRQIVLGELMVIATELTAMAATCAYARHLDAPGSCTKDSATELADYFCRGARRRIAESFRRINRDHPRSRRSVSKGVLEGRFEWLEKGAIESR